MKLESAFWQNAGSWTERRTDFGHERRLRPLKGYGADKTKERSGQAMWSRQMAKCNVSAREKSISRRGWLLVLRKCAWACLFSDLAILLKSSFLNFIYQFISLSIHLSIHILICLYRSICERNNSNNNAGTTHHANLLFAVPCTAICNIQYVLNYQFWHKIIVLS